ncbi:MAG TPA: exodeoxyribonuclease V subunit gamma, partial [Polyangiaceae bacterium]|nr:exodeoxyribonuclease V subunit gamma [Polyangiaceae bacterium]
MLTVHQSNRLEALADGLADVLAQPLASVFASEIVVVQSRGVARWLSLRLADRAGICANVRFPFPAAFTWELYRCAFGYLPEQSSSDPGVLTWRILDLLPELEDSAGFEAVKRYVAGSDLRRFELAARLAELYDEYLVYRPDWIASWERESSADWQGQLWRRLSAESAGAHGARLNREFMKLLATDAAPVSIPQRVCVFGAPALAPSVLELLCALASRRDVHLFIQNPCSAYWGDIASERTIARKRVQGKSDAAYLDTGNSLLASFGKQGRDFIDLLAGLSGDGAGERDSFIDPSRETRLASIQSDILELEELTP